jgi:hypothetical protein
MQIIFVVDAKLKYGTASNVAQKKNYVPQSKTHDGVHGL